MLYIVGLGNPGNKYENNRHNVGSMFINYLVNALTSLRVKEFKFNKYLQSEICEIPSLNSCLITPYPLNLLLIKPQTYMNLSGTAIKACVKQYNINVKSDLIVVHDDLDIPLGKFKLDFGTGPKLHNGITSIEQHLKTKDFWRVRIGVDNRTAENRTDGEAYVLQDFKQDEKNQLASVVFLKIQEALSRHISTL